MMGKNITHKTKHHYVIEIFLMCRNQYKVEYEQIDISLII